MNIKKLKIHPSLFFFMALMFAFGHIKPFLILVFVTAFHELAHVAAAKLKGLDIDKFIITPIGDVAHINGFETASGADRAFILLAGPGVNIITAAIIGVFWRKAGGYTEMLMYISLAIGVFNLMPIYPLDGGKLLHVSLGNMIGILKSGKLVGLFAKVGIALLFIAGFFQVVLYPFNISILAIAVFLVSIYKREKAGIIFSFYKCMINKDAKIMSRSGVKTKTAVFDISCNYSEIQQIFTWDHYHIIYIIENGTIVETLTERQIFESATGAFDK